MLLSSFQQPLGLAEEQRAALVRGETPRETDGQDFGVENLVHLPHLRRRFAEALALDADPVAGKIDEARLEFLVRFPEHVVGDAVDAQPIVHVREVFLPVRAEVLGVQTP